MPDFDANDDPLRLSGSAKEEPFDVPKLRPRFTPRARSLAYGHCFRRSIGSSASTRALAEQTWRNIRRTCVVMSPRTALTASARQRRLSLMCHGRPPGSPS